MILENYVWQAPSFLSVREVDDIIHASEKLPWHAGEIGGHNKDKDGINHDKGGTEDWSIRSSQIKWVNTGAGEMPEHIDRKSVV